MSKRKTTYFNGFKKRLFKALIFTIVGTFLAGLIQDIFVHNMGYVYYGSKFKFTDVELTSGDSIMYLGKTDNYLFFYDKKKRSSIIYPNSELKKMTLSNSPLFFQQ